MSIQATETPGWLQRRQANVAQGVLTALPIATALILKAVGGSAMDPLFNTGYGHSNSDSFSRRLL